MGWRERLDRASFRGVDFWIDSTQYERARRVSLTERAGADGATPQDHGAKAPAVEIAAFLWGDNYDIARDELEDALSEAGPGPLVIPHRGEKWVRITRGPRTTETKDDGGYCTIRFSAIVEDPSAGSLRAVPDTAGQLKAAASAVRAAASGDFTDIVDTSGLPTKYLDSTLGAISEVTNTLRTATGKIASGLSVIDNVTAAINDLEASINTLLATPASLVSKLLDLAGSVMSLANTVKNGLDRLTGLPKFVNGNAFERSRSTRIANRSSSLMAGLGSDAKSTGSVPLAQREADNTRAVFRVARAGTLAGFADVVADAPFDSADFAVEVLDNIVEEVEALQLYGASDDLHNSLADLRAAAQAHLSQVADDLPRILTKRPKRTVPSLLLAHELYGDAAREPEIVARNRPKHPLFLSGDLEVVADG